jgi:myo-inositol-1(or 4)-monophosphatase
VTLSPAHARDVAVEVITEASALLREGWGKVTEVRSKELATDLVTEWDTRLERFIAAELGKRCPGVPVLGEELGASGPGGAEERWVVDPIDGTVNFAHGFPIFAISIGYEQRGEPLAGAVSAPALGWLYAAARGEGATLGGAPIHVSATAELERAMLVTGFPYDRKISPRNNFEAFVHMQRTAGAVRRLGAAALDLCFVACGWLDGYWELKLKPWDLAAGAVIVAEAGGRVTGIDGGPLSLASGDVVASNGKIHEAMLAELAGRL